MHQDQRQSAKCWWGLDVRVELVRRVHHVACFLRALGRAIVHKYSLVLVLARETLDSRPLTTVFVFVPLLTFGEG